MVLEAVFLGLVFGLGDDLAFLVLGFGEVVVFGLADCLASWLFVRAALLWWIKFFLAARSMAW